jgi:hypothetical protein
MANSDHEDEDNSLPFHLVQEHDDLASLGGRKTISLNVANGYGQEWGCEHAFRELFQNWSVFCHSLVSQ